MQRYVSFTLLALIAQGSCCVSGAQSQSTLIFADPSHPKVANRIDKLVSAKLKGLGITPSAICTDSVFVRRVYLDVIGTLPAAEEVRSFLTNEDFDKRSQLIDHLLERDEFADYWSLKWCDLLRVKSEFPIKLWPNAVQAYHRWVRDSIRHNMPYDQFVRELLTESGSNFRVPQVNFLRAVQNRKPESLAQAVALTFMGVRTENWEPERLAGMAAFFQGISYKLTREWKEEIVYVNLLDTSPEALAQRPPYGIFPDGRSVGLPHHVDPRLIFTDWLVHPDNPWFTRNIVNRIWSWLLGIGIINEPDDIRPDNPPTNPELLRMLQNQLVVAEFNLKHMYRLILNSRAYQRSCIPTTDRPEAELYFAHYPLRRLHAEVLIDAINQITGATESYSSLIPEPWTFIPPTQATITLADGSISSPFLDLFGRPARDTGLELERNNEPSAAQKLHLLNSSHIRNKIEARYESTEASSLSRRRFRSSVSRALPTPEQVTEVYLTVLSRFPTDKELAIVSEHAMTLEANASTVLKDLTWALMNTSEFLYRH